ncbi:MAG: pseudouridine kinase [Fusobacteriaceae bacterium]|jgi:pseudouridine kinase|nr:kinase [Fusobacteriales bacterium]MDN5303682.1 pseudouridine kinase [Fusobacteriaceae bacterium]
MTEREEEILQKIKENPMISQNELADMLNITRSSIAVHISNLMKKGYIKGKGYILKENPYICVVGGANIDIQGFPKEKLNQNDSNPGDLKISLGGVGRNIAENLVKLSQNTKLITVLGDDIYGKKILEHSLSISLDINDSLILKNKNTSTYLSILDETGDMYVAISAMDIFDELDIDFIHKKMKYINGADITVIDTNIPQKTIEYILKTGNSKFYLDTVSVSKAKKVKDFIGYFHTIKPNKLEAEVLSGIPINNELDLDKNAEYFFNKGVKEVFITLGKDGVYYNNKKEKGIFKTKEHKVVNATGAGDAFMAGLIYSTVNNFSIKEKLSFSLAASILTMQSTDTINPDFNFDNIKKIEKEI